MAPTFALDEYAALGFAVTESSTLEAYLRGIVATTRMRRDDTDHPIDEDHPHFRDAFINLGLPKIIQKVNEEIEALRLDAEDSRKLAEVLYGPNGSRDCYFVVWRNLLCHVPMIRGADGKLVFKFYDKEVFRNPSGGSGPSETSVSAAELHALAQTFNQASRILHRTIPMPE
jgi:hypothetical protein